MMFTNSNKPRAVFRGKQTFICECTGRWFPGCAPCDPCATQENDPTPPPNCGWLLTINDGNTDIIVAIPNESSIVIPPASIANGAAVSVTFNATAIASPVGSIQVLTSGATNLNGTSTYVGATPTIPTGNTSLVGTLTLDTETAGTFQTTINITTNCGPIDVELNYTVEAP